MKSRASSLLRLSMRLSLGLLLLLGLCLGLGVTVRPAYASKIITVSPRDQSHLQVAVNEANKDNDGDTIKFNCGGSADIKLTSTLAITGNMTIDGSGQSVTLDGQNTVAVFSADSPNLTLTALTIANGKASTPSNDTGGGISNAGTLSTSVRSSGSIVAENSAPQGNDCYGTITDKGYNLESGTDCGFTGTGSLQNVSNAQLALSALANNGGPTQTMAL